MTPGMQDFGNNLTSLNHPPRYHVVLNIGIAVQDHEILPKRAK